MVMKVISRYQGAFLAGDERDAWFTATRERLRSRFLRLAEKSGHHWVRIEHYEKNQVSTTTLQTVPT